MSSHPTRRKYRAGERRSTLARDPFAAGIFLAENPNRGKRGAAHISYATRTLANLEAIARFENRCHGETPDVTFPARDRIGRLNPRAPRTPTASGRPL
jgi:hypothetical protein